jgi:hypothetical protein
MAAGSENGRFSIMSPTNETSCALQLRTLAKTRLFIFRDPFGSSFADLDDARSLDGPESSPMSQVCSVKASRGPRHAYFKRRGVVEAGKTTLD